MQFNRRILASTLALVALAVASPAFAGSLNKNIRIGDNESSKGGNTVNGSISVGRGATVDGALETVNGSIRVGEGASVENVETVNGGLDIGDDVKARDLSSVNGAISVGANTAVDGDVTVVNGRITLEKGASVADDVSTVNGSIRLIHAEVNGDMSTVNGDVTLDEASVLKGTLTIEKPSGHYSNSRKPEVVIGPGSRVLGGIIAEREIELFISDTAEVSSVSGVMSMDDAQRYSGARPGSLNP